MKISDEIDTLALYASPLAAPAVLAVFGLAGTWSSSEAGVFSAIFWQVALACAYTPIYYAISLLLVLIIWRVFPKVRVFRKSVTGPLIATACVFAISVNSYALGFRNIGPFDSEAFRIFVGVVLNIIFFVWLMRRSHLLDSLHGESEQA
ncbi:hypothetical protein [Stenotrophobium rhamnosiphilum]|uniref:Uncharacterized protein n=1 Tax=Stenotrophobium rhamnosiphilum TaxID=2029166 RepID=A0A2T5MDE8_9GAMM|nr:hypothetical protein [Stenotrophobium rhamnosiphilum]PTU30592.1 hypothetical protein CJD38_13885 [Stenotrophobium rhamnosiphilum]